MSRRRPALKRQNNDEASGLAGWMYTDLLLGLAVVFLGSIGVVVLAGNNSEEVAAEGNSEIVDGENNDVDSEDVAGTATGPTTTTSTTTTVPVELCSVLYDPPADSSDGLEIRIEGRPPPDEMAKEFRSKLTEKLGAVNRSLPAGTPKFTFSNINIALTLTYHGPMPDGSSGNTEAKRIFDDLKLDFPVQFENAVGRNLKRTSGNRATTIEVFLVYERPCSQGE